MSVIDFAVGVSAMWLLLVHGIIFAFYLSNPQAMESAFGGKTVSQYLIGLLPLILVCLRVLGAI